MQDTDFDCVAMKQEIQKQIIEETQGLSWDDYCRQTETVILANPILGPIFQHARAATRPSHMAEEARGD